jgi:hypothetical protein
MSFEFQVERDKFVDSLKEIITADVDNIIEEINKYGLSKDLNIHSIIKPLMDINFIEIKLPEDLFKFANPSKMEEYTEKKRREGSRTKKGGSCSSDKHEPYTYSYDETRYQVIFETIDGLRLNWELGITASQSEFWNIINEWVNDAVKTNMDKLKNIIPNIIDDLDKSLMEREKQIDNGEKQNEKVLNNIANETQILNNLKSDL